MIILYVNATDDVSACRRASMFGSLEEQSFPFGGPMPRVTPAHEQAVRDRIIAAALRVFGEKGYRRATVQDVVRESGLSVGAIYTYFKSKDELFLASCDLTSGRGLAELAERITAGTTAVERLLIGIDVYLRSIDEFQGMAGQATLVQAWAEAEQEPSVREMLVRRREQLVGAGQMLVREGIARGELPAWLDVEGFTRAFIGMLDGLLLQRIEAGDPWRPEELERRARAMLELVVAAADAPRPELGATPPPPASGTPPRPPIRAA
jgi:AcrR family transcriptional regulator